MSREIPKPYLIAKDEEGAFRLTVREVRYNSQGYPLVTATPVDEWDALSEGDDPTEPERP